MKRVNISAFSICYLCLGMATVLFAANGKAQELRLFEEIETDREENSRGRSPNFNSGSSVNGPTLTLIGITRIGNAYSVILRDGGDKSISVRSSNNNNTMIPGYPGYSISQITSEGANLNYPEDSTCVELLPSGIRCLEDRVARLSLAKTDPLRLAGTNQSEPGQENVNEEEATLNPFEAIARRSQNSNPDRTDNQQFRPRRINPEDVPPGMRVVSTPFGDRLVEDE